MDEPTVELKKIDVRYESYRLPSKEREKNLLDSISASGIQHPLEGVWIDNSFVLLDGFKRMRVGKRLNVNIFPARVMADTEVEAIFALIRSPSIKPLHLLEEAKLVNKLHVEDALTVRAIADRLGKSIGWVGSRIGLLNEFSEKVWRAVFSGDIPSSSITNTLRSFKRLNKDQVNEFVDIIKGKGLGYRDIQVLGRAWVEGGRDIREQIRGGNLCWTIKNLKEEEKKTPHVEKKLTSQYSMMINDFVLVEKCISRLILKSTFRSDAKNDYTRQAGVIAERILRMQDRFMDLLEKTVEKSR